MTYGVVSENGECRFLNLICSFHSMMNSLFQLLLLALNHSFHYPILKRTAIDTIVIQNDSHTFCEGVLRAEPLSLCGLRLLSL